MHANLLLRSDEVEHFKVHDIVFDFAMSASSTDLFMVNHGHELTKWPRKDSYKKYVAISLECGKMFQVSEELNCRDLKLLQLTGERFKTFSLTFPDSFFEGIPELNILDLRSVVIPLTMRSMQCLSNIRSFSLYQSSIAIDVSMIGNLPNLEVLSFARSMIKELPAEIGKLKKLRLLDLTGCKQLREIAAGVFSQLTSLEELYMRGTCVQFNSGSRAVYSEIKSMSTLAVIHIVIPFEVLPLDTLFKMLKKFKISILQDEEKEKMGCWWEETWFGSEFYEGNLENTLSLQCNSSALQQSGIKMLLMEAVRLNLTIGGLKTLFPLNESKTVVSFNLKSLSLESCNELVYLAHLMGDQDQYNVFQELVTLGLKMLPCLKEILHARNSGESIVCPFRNLKFLEVYDCQELEYIFTLSTARGLSKLEDINVPNCENLKLVFAKEGEGVGTVKFPNLKSLSLKNLPKLVGCHDILDSVEFPCLENLNLTNLPLITSLCHSETRTSTSTDTDAPSHPFLTQKGSGTAITLQNLTLINVLGCSSLRNLSTLSMALSFGELKILNLRDCQLLEEVVAAEDKIEDDGSIREVLLLPKLKELHLDDLPSLSTIYPEGCTLRWSSLESLAVENCGTESVGLYSDKNEIQCDSTTGDKIVLSSLEYLAFSKTKSLKWWRKQHASVSLSDEQIVLFSDDSIRQLQNLKNISLQDIESLEVVFDLEQKRTVESLPNAAILHKLEGIRIASLPKMTFIWKNVPTTIEKFGNLTILDVSKCDSLRYLLSPSLAKVLVKLKMVETSECSKIEEFVSGRDEEGQEKLFDIFFFPQLEKLVFKSLPCLWFLGPGVCDFDVLPFEAPYIANKEKNAFTNSCVTLVRSEVGCSWSLHNLTSLWVYECGNMFSLFQPNLRVKLPALRTLTIEKCDTLKHVFISSTVGYLEQLKQLTINECKMMEEIVKDEDEEEVGRSGKVMFPSLESVDLARLSSLKGICLGTFVFEWPSLKSVQIHRCQKMGMFTSGYSDTPVLDKLNLNSYLHSLEEGGSNINAAFTNLLEKIPDNFVFKEEDILTSNSFILAGNRLVANCPGWKWEIGCPSSDNNHENFLIRRSVPCLERARTTTSIREESEEEDKNETDSDGKINDDGKNILCTPRTYSTIFTYDEDSRTPILWLQGFDEKKKLLPLECVLEDIAEHYPLEYVSLKPYRYKASATCVYLPLSPQPSRYVKQGIQLTPENYFQVFLDSLIPTIQSCVP